MPEPTRLSITSVLSHKEGDKEGIVDERCQEEDRGI
jgi:hypothetical protein